ncbi:MAG: hypothetical protein RLZZ352_671 [Pseudomonadota bacterium]
MRWYHQQESNLYLALRRHSFYPLNYGGGVGLQGFCRVRIVAVGPVPSPRMGCPMPMSSTFFRSRYTFSLSS